MSARERKISATRYEVILSRLDEGPATPAQLAAIVGCRVWIVQRLCRRLLTEHRVTWQPEGTWTLIEQRRAARPRPAEDAQMPAHRTIRVAGVEYDVMFDGRGESPDWPLGSGSGLLDFRRWTR